MNITNRYCKQIAKDILMEKNTDYKWLNVKLNKLNRIDSIDKIHNYFVNPSDCRWWFGNTKKQRYINLCKKVPKGKRKEFQTILEYLHYMRITYDLYIPEYHTINYKFEKNITKPGYYQLCHNGIIVKKIDNPNDECPICYDVFTNNDYFITKCGHKFCGSCIFKHYNGKDNKVNTTCPLCRQSFLNIDIQEFTQSRTNLWNDYTINSELSTQYIQEDNDNINIQNDRVVSTRLFEDIEHMLNDNVIHASVNSWNDVEDYITVPAYEPRNILTGEVTTYEPSNIPTGEVTAYTFTTPDYPNPDAYLTHP